MTNEVNELLAEAENLGKFENYSQVIDLFRQHYLVPDDRAIRVAMCGIVAHYFTSDPLWVFLIAPPSSMKTEIISAFDGIADIYQLSSMTSQTFFSGLRKTKGQTGENSLMLKITNKILTLKDFGTVLNMRFEDKAIVLGQLREIYDGSYNARYGNNVEIDWKGRIGFIAGVTPIIDTHYSVFQTLGERFVQFRLPPIDEEELGDIALGSIGKEKKNRKLIRNAIASFITQLKVPDITTIEVSPEIKHGIVALSSLVVRARSGVIRDSYRKTIEYIPEPEAPARLAKQLLTLCCASAVIDKRTQVNISDYLLTIKVGLDCIPRQRIAALNYVASDPSLAHATGSVAQGTDYSTEGIRVHLEDLNAHGLLSIEKGGRGTADTWQVSEKLINYVSRIVISKEILNSEIAINDKNYANILQIFEKLEKNETLS